jgi:exonuclease III
METQTKQRHDEINRSYGQMYLTDIYRTFYFKTKEYTFFSTPLGTLSRIDHIICNKTGLNRYKKTEIVPVHSIRSTWTMAGLQ